MGSFPVHGVAVISCAGGGFDVAALRRREEPRKLAERETESIRKRAKDGDRVIVRTFPVYVYIYMYMWKHTRACN